MVLMLMPCVYTAALVSKFFTQRHAGTCCILPSHTTCIVHTIAKYHLCCFTRATV